MIKFSFTTDRIITIVVIFITIVVLQGFKSVNNDKVFPAPLKNPIIALCYDFESTKIYRDKSLASDSIKLLSKEINKYNSNLDCKKAANSLYELLSVKNLVFSKVYFYLTEDKEFVFILKGQFPWKHIANKFHANTIIERNGGFSTSLPANYVDGQRLSLNIYQDFILLCPENISGNVIDAYLSDKNQLNNNYTVFKKMIKKGAALAMEANFTKLLKIFESANYYLPNELKEIKHIRLIIHPEICKLQLILNEKNKIDKIAKSLLKITRNYLPKVASNTVKIKNSSIYLSSKPEKIITRQVSNQISGFLLQCLPQNQSKAIMLSKNEKGGKYNDNSSIQNGK